MRIRAIETVRIEERPNLLWVEVHTDEGISGLGETFFLSRTVEEYLHEYVAPRVIGRDPLAIDLLSADLVGYLGFRSTGAEVRGNSAFDIALWRSGPYRWLGWPTIVLGIFAIAGPLIDVAVRLEGAWMLLIGVLMLTDTGTQPTSAATPAQQAHTV